MKDIIATAGKIGNKLLFKAREASPKIKVMVGIAGFFGAAVLIFKETRKVEPILDEHKKKIADISKKKESGELDKDAAGKEYANTYLSTAKSLGKLYLRSGLLMGASTALVLSGTNTLSERLSGTAAALAALDGKFKKAEERTTAKYGKEVADEIFYGLKKEVVASKELDTETGEEKDILEEHTVIDKDELPLFTEFFDASSDEYEKGNPTYNRFFLKNALKDIKRINSAWGFITYNQIRKRFGYRPLKDEYGMDWGYEAGDVIDLGLDDTDDEAIRRFINGYEDVCLIKFKGMHPLRKDLKAAYGYKKV